MTVQAFDRRINKVRDIQIRTDMFSGLAVFFGVLTIFRYKSSNVEAMQAALFKYLELKGVGGATLCRY
tara:strand:- start:27 stop:230 length:204 start_codon:yes stop_codon:yes gene_type:complete